MKEVRAVVIVVDGGGVGASEDAARYGDDPRVNSIANAARAAGSVRMPVLERLGLGLLASVRGVEPASAPLAACARLREQSNGKDSVTGHWEMMGIRIAHAFPTYPHGFPSDLIERYEALIGRRILGNEVASGTEIIERLGPEHQRTGYPIVYTSADSVFQVAAHEDVVPLELLWEWCQQARDMLVPPNRVNRVIARPFSGSAGSFVRTAGRRDFAVRPPSPSLLELLEEAGVSTYGLGKIQDIYSCQGLAGGSRTADNAEGLARTLEWLQKKTSGFCFTNLNDFDSKYGHRRDPLGYAKALEAMDAKMADLLDELHEGDRLIVTADHGCDPTAPGTDHTREFAPLLDYRPGVAGAFMGELDSFAQVGERVLQTFAVPAPREMLSV